MTSLVIVESPAKAKTIEKFLGKDYRVVATYGHIRDLPSKDGSVDTENGFLMSYEIPKTSTRHVEALVKAAKEAQTLLLATDPDREGEAISWHVQEILKSKKDLADKPMQRVVFHEITKRAIQEAITHARDVNHSLVNAQQARRALDYLVGFNLSPLLWKKVRYGLSAGRVQSVALRLICDREKEIQDFVVQEYWSIVSQLGKKATGRDGFKARLVVAEGKKLSKFDIPNEAIAQSHVAAIQGKAVHVHKVDKNQVKRNPAPPFITSTLQQEASRKLGFSTKRCMVVAQHLYEGVEVPTEDGGKEVVGLITYMRTDSVNLADEAVESMRQVIGERFGPEFVPKAPRRYKSSAKNAQEAHEAIRPTDPRRSPEMVKGSLERDQFRLYELIWKRAMACQMESARVDQVVATLTVGENSETAPYQLRATGSSIAFPGFIEIYTEGKDEVSLQDRDEDETQERLPVLNQGDTLVQRQVDPLQHFTEPKPRYTEATLVRALESFGIGRPSTYSPTMSTLQDRGYVRLESGKFFPEDVGVVVNSFLTAHFPKYVDYHFTARMEDGLDAISRGEKEWIPLLQDFWQPFIGQVREKEQSTKKSDVTTEVTSEECPQCGKPVMIRLGRYGRFKACSGYPECRYTMDLRKEGKGEEEEAQPEVSDQTCEKCGKSMLIKSGRYGKYLACSGYPDCRNIQPLEKPKVTGVKCPACKSGEFQEKKSRYGKIFYSCSNYPKCKNAVWDPPENVPCPKCGHPVTTVKRPKRGGPSRNCPVEGCGHKEPLEEGDSPVTKTA
ncbi:MAG: type I DNA topoisomerase [Magnetococcales bacterium]|nr:type I DNA topoisomerase [Magnetococcales bacterium]